jgi:hypothetical protein
MTLDTISTLDRQPYVQHFEPFTADVIWSVMFCKSLSRRRVQGYEDQRATFKFCISRAFAPVNMQTFETHVAVEEPRENALEVER